MGSLFNRLAKPLFFRLDPETAHTVAIDGLTVLARTPGLCRLMGAFSRLPEAVRPVEAFGLRFPNRVGLAAGFDKDGVCWPAFAALGFGHVEIGTVTARAQPGNPQPRLFRYPEQGALLNRMGFNNAGAAAMAARLLDNAGAGQRRAPLGINIGKSKTTPLDDAVADYRRSFLELADFADYIAINVSSPNTPELRKLQEEDRLRELLGTLKELNDARTQRRPLLLKIAPDLTLPQVDVILQILSDLAFDGIIATNTTMAREGAFADAQEAGGLSGKPLREQSTAIVTHISRQTQGRLPIIGVGGIDDMDSAAEKMDAGATLVQIYSGMIYHGPFLAKRIARALAKRQGDWQ